MIARVSVLLPSSGTTCSDDRITWTGLHYFYCSYLYVPTLSPGSKKKWVNGGTLDVIACTIFNSAVIVATTACPVDETLMQSSRSRSGFLVTWNVGTTLKTSRDGTKPSESMVLLIAFMASFSAMRGLLDRWVTLLVKKIVDSSAW